MLGGWALRRLVGGDPDQIAIVGIAFVATAAAQADNEAGGDDSSDQGDEAQAQAAQQGGDLVGLMSLR